MFADNGNTHGAEIEDLKTENLRLRAENQRLRTGFAGTLSPIMANDTGWGGAATTPLATNPDAM